LSGEAVPQSPVPAHAIPSGARTPTSHPMPEMCEHHVHASIADAPTQTVQRTPDAMTPLSAMSTPAGPPEGLPHPPAAPTHMSPAASGGPGHSSVSGAEPCGAHVTQRGASGSPGGSPPAAPALYKLSPRAMLDAKGASCASPDAHAAPLIRCWSPEIGALRTVIMPGSQQGSPGGPNSVYELSPVRSEPYPSPSSVAGLELSLESASPARVGPCGSRPCVDESWASCEDRVAEMERSTQGSSREDLPDPKPLSRSWAGPELPNLASPPGRRSQPVSRSSEDVITSADAVKPVILVLCSGMGTNLPHLYLSSTNRSYKPAVVFRSQQACAVLCRASTSCSRGVKHMPGDYNNFVTKRESCSGVSRCHRMSGAAWLISLHYPFT
jgi:hypothetical protein